MDFNLDGKKVADGKFKGRTTSSLDHVAAPTSDGKGLNFNHDNEASTSVDAKVKTSDGRKGKMDVSGKS